MEVKIKQGNEMLDATIEMVDGVMVVSPKVVKFEPKDGDVITCGWDEGKQRYNWTGILQGEIEYISDNMFIGDYCSLDCKGAFLDHNSGSDSATWVRYATEEEKKILFDKLKEEGYEFDFEKKELVKLKWKPVLSEVYFRVEFVDDEFRYADWNWKNSTYEIKAYERGWCFKNEEECKSFCDKLNQAIDSVKP